MDAQSTSRSPLGFHGREGSSPSVWELHFVSPNYELSVVLVDGLNVDFSGFAGEAMRQLIKRFLNVIRVQVGSVYRGILGENVAYFVHSFHTHSIPRA